MLLMDPVDSVILMGKCQGGHYIVACTSTRNCSHVFVLDCTENLALTFDYPALTMPIDRLENL